MFNQVVDHWPASATNTADMIKGEQVWRNLGQFAPAFFEAIPRVIVCRKPLFAPSATDAYPGRNLAQLGLQADQIFFRGGLDIRQQEFHLGLDGNLGQKMVFPQQIGVPRELHFNAGEFPTGLLNPMQAKKGMNPVDLGGLGFIRSEEHTSELQSRQYLVCRLLLEKKKKNIQNSELNLTRSDVAAHLSAQSCV